MERFVVMGVSGCGKSSIGSAFADQIGARFVDADDLHPESNITKMATGDPLTDDDRAPWLVEVGHQFETAPLPLVIGCSALRRSYRDIIRDHAKGPVAFLHLAGSKALIAGRMAARQDHFMPPALLDSQFETLEPPAADEHAITVTIDQTPDEIVTELVAHFEKGTG